MHNALYCNCALCRRKRLVYHLRVTSRDSIPLTKPGLRVMFIINEITGDALDRIIRAHPMGIG